MQLSGKCLCESVKFSFKTKSKSFGACHCSMCLKWGGGPAFAVDASEGIEIENTEFVKTYSSSDWAERGFCSNCGTHLFYKLKNGKYWNVSLGVLDDQSDFKFTHQVYVDNNPGFYHFSEETKMMTEADVLKLFGVEP